MTTLTVLGSGTLLPDAQRASPSHHLGGPHLSLLLDCGSGAMHGMARFGIAWRELTHIALSHYHTDHVGDLPPLLWAFRHGAEGRSEPLTILGPADLGGYMASLARAYGDFILDPGFPLRLVELAEDGVWRDEEAGLLVAACPTPHTERSLAFRVDTGSAVVGYTGDTGPSPLLGAFFRGVDLLVTECAAAEASDGALHLSPVEVAALVRDAQPAVTVLTHLYPPLDPDTVPDLVRGPGVTGTVLAGRDGMRMSLPDADRSQQGPATPSGRSPQGG